MRIRWWRDRVRQAKPAATVRFAPVRPVAAAVAPLRGPATAGLDVSVGDAVVHVRAGFDEGLLRSVVDALRSPHVASRRTRSSFCSRSKYDNDKARPSVVFSALPRPDDSNSRPIGKCSSQLRTNQPAFHALRIRTAFPICRAHASTTRDCPVWQNFASLTHVSRSDRCPRAQQPRYPPHTCAPTALPYCTTTPAAQFGGKLITTGAAGSNFSS
jgi:hypothetical protein